MRPIMNSSTEDIEKTIEEKTSLLNDKIDRLSKTLENPKDEKVDDILAKLKAKQGSSTKIPTEKHEHNHEDIFCPTCNKGVMHKMVGSGLNLKCADGSCGKEYVIVPKDANAQCKTCGLPLRDDIKVDSCPFCNGKQAKLFDFSKLTGKK